MYFDEINKLKKTFFEEKELNEENKEIITDSILEMLVFAYVMGVQDANKMLVYNGEIVENQFAESIDKKIKGENWKDRVSNSINSKEEIERIIDTETHRVYNEAIYNTGANKGNKITKQWATMLDDKVRDTHFYLEGEEKPLNERFYTLDGDSALYPGGFENGSNNCNCRCYLLLKG